MNVCVFCGSSMGDNPLFQKLAEDLGVSLAKSNFTLVYGGGKVGLMGVLADSVLRNNGQVIGVIPDFLLKKEVGHTGVTRLEVVSSMHERKKKMADLSSIFVALPGGWGTLDELAEILTWKQLQLIDRGVCILNADGFFDHLIAQMKRMAQSGFLRQGNLDSVKIVNSVSELMSHIISYSASLN